MIPPHLERFTKPTPILDHGYIMLVDVMGDDDAIIQAARVSYAKGTQKTSNDRNLLRYLMRARHTSPFEQARIKLEIKLPIFVERQWVRHRTASLNEMSARYSVLSDEFYVPEPEDVRAQSTTNRQGRDGALGDQVVQGYRAGVQKTCADAYEAYEKALDSGVARELARCLLPVNIYTSKVWTMDLHNLFHFLRLRMDPHAQKEIRLYANAIAEIVKEWVPWAWEAFEDYQLNGMYLTKFEVAGLKGLLGDMTRPPQIFTIEGANLAEIDNLKEEISKAQEDPDHCVFTNVEVDVQSLGSMPPEKMAEIAIEGSGLPKGRERAHFKKKLDSLLG